MYLVFGRGDLYASYKKRTSNSLTAHVVPPAKMRATYACAMQHALRTTSGSIGDSDTPVDESQNPGKGQHVSLLSPSAAESASKQNPMKVSELRGEC